MAGPAKSGTKYIFSCRLHPAVGGFNYNGNACLLYFGRGSVESESVSSDLLLSMHQNIYYNRVAASLQVILGGFPIHEVGR